MSYLQDVSEIGAPSAMCAVCSIDTYYRLVLVGGGHVPLCSDECERAWPTMQAMRANNDRLRARVVELERDRVALARHIREQTFKWPKDHACGECVPTGEIAVPGFRCAVHLALSIPEARPFQEGVPMKGEGTRG